jgi:hypothetical protein
VRRYPVITGFAEHDERFGSRAEVGVPLEAAPTREEAVRLVWAAVHEETTKALGEGDWLPSLNWVDVFELLDDPSRAGLAPESAAGGEGGLVTTGPG